MVSVKSPVIVIDQKSKRVKQFFKAKK